MGWAHCGTDRNGREIGYAIEATCDHPGCGKAIHRGLAYACGGMHGEDTRTCDQYFCEEHLSAWLPETPGGRIVRVCAECDAAWRREFPEEAIAFDEE
jgi:hypothetical protein